MRNYNFKQFLEIMKRKQGKANLQACTKMIYTSLLDLNNADDYNLD